MILSNFCLMTNWGYMKFIYNESSAKSDFKEGCFLASLLACLSKSGMVEIL